MADSRLVNTKRNIASGLLKQITTIVLPFIIRTIVLYILGAQYQGLSGLFTSILQVLSLSELGFSTAVSYVLYKPIADDDRDVVCAIVAFLKKAYTVVGIIIGIGGVIIMPILPKLIKGSVPGDINIYILFLIYLFNTVISYSLFAYKSVLLTSMQREDIVSNIYTATSLASKIIQIIVLLAFKNYYIFIIFTPISTIANNILLQVFAKRYFPHIVPKGKINNDTKRELIEQIKAIFINKIGDTARNSFDNIILSTFMGLTVVAIYDNYYYIFTALYGVALVIIHAMQASVGNSMAKESVHKNGADLNKFTFIFMWIIGWATICLCCLYQPFMMIWMKGQDELLLSNFDMVLFCVYFYAINMNDTRNLYLSGAGLYPKCKLYFVMEAFGNLALNIVLGKLFGVTGVIIATIITIFVFNFVTRTNVLFKFYFKSSALKFYLAHSTYALVTAVICFITYILCGLVPFNGVIGLMIKAFICALVPNLLYFLIYNRTKRFKEAYVFCLKIIKE